MSVRGFKILSLAQKDRIRERPWTTLIETTLILFISFERASGASVPEAIGL
jgi:hypothetical protein